MKKTLKKAMSILIALTLILGSFSFGVSEIKLFDFGMKADATEECDSCPYGDGGYYVDGEYKIYCHESKTNHCHCHIKNGEAIVDRVMILDYTGTLVVPSSHYNYKVTTIDWASTNVNSPYLQKIIISDGIKTIGDYVFENAENLESVTIGDGVKTIGNYAFSGCSGLTEINIPDSVNTIGVGAFNFCGNLTNVSIGKGVTSIGSIAFQWCNLSNVTIPGNVQTIGDSAFYFCSNLKNVMIENGVTSIGKKAFALCNGLKAVAIPDSVTFLGEQAFQSCRSLESLSIGNGLTDIGDKAFIQCTSLNKVTLGENVTTIGKGAFNECSSLKNITLPDSLTTIGEKAFYDCESLTEIEIPYGLTTIGDGAFRLCDSLISVTIPASVTSIGNKAFAHCQNLELITVDKNNENYLSDGGILFTKDKTRLMQYPAGSKRTNYAVPDGVTTIDESAISTRNLEYIHIPESVTSIGSIGLADNAYICSTSEDGYIKDYAEANNITYVVCHHGEHSHTPVTTTIPPTCTTEGTEHVVCGECGAVISEKTIPAKGHTAGNWTVEVLATCTENGTKVKKCVDCGEIQQSEPIIATGHTPGEWVIIKPATTTTTGIKAQRCANCSEILTSEDTPVLTEKVHGVSVSGGSIDYKSTIKIAPIINADEGVGYTVTYSSSNPDAVVIDENGNVIAKGVGVAEITVTVTDEKGNVVTDTCEIEVRYNWWQWIIRILLLGFLWY